MMLDWCNTCPLISWCMPYACASSKGCKIPCISSISIDVRSGCCPSNQSIKLYRGIASGPNLSLTIDHKFLLHSLDFGVIQWSWWNNCSGQNLLILLTLHLCRFSFNMQVMILMGSYYRLSSLAVTSVDGCCLYIIIHNGILHRTWL